MACTSVDWGAVELDNRIYKSLTFESTGGCLTVDVPDRKWNADELRQVASDLSDLCEQIAWMENVRVVLLGFAGDIIDRQSPALEKEPGPIRLVEPVAGLKQPVIAAIRGDAFGLGLELALACDIRIGSEGARFGLPQVCEGRIPSNGGTQRLPRLIGQGCAMKMILTGEAVEADEAQRIGLLNRVVSIDSLIRTAHEMAREMATKSPLSLSYVKEALYCSKDLTLDQGLDKELDLYLLLHSAQDRTEGIKAFKEKRKPDFKGV